MKKGIDVSTHNGVIDWPKVKAAGYDFAIIRTGYGNTLKYPNQIDKYFKENMENAIAVGIDVGVYHFSYAKTPEAAKQEAKCVIDLIKNYKLTYPVCFDFEYDSERVAGKLDRPTLTAIAKAFMDEIEQAGYYAMFYSNLDYCRNRYDMEALSKYDLWLAEYNCGAPSIACGIQQTGSTGKVDGIVGNVDTNVAYKSYPEIIRVAGLNHLGGKDAPAKPSAPATPVIGTATVIADSGLNLRRGPSTVNSVITAIPCGKAVEVLEHVSAEWDKVKYDGVVGYCYKIYLSNNSVDKKEEPKAGAKVRYSGPLYGDSYGGNKGKSISGTYTVQRVIENRKCGVQLPAGWVSANDCTLV